MSRPRDIAGQTPRERQLESFLTILRENGSRQLATEFLAAFSKIAPPVLPKTSTAPVNSDDNAYVVRGFWVASASVEEGTDKCASQDRQWRLASGGKRLSYGGRSGSRSNDSMWPSNRSDQSAIAADRS